MSMAIKVMKLFFADNYYWLFIAYNSVGHKNFSLLFWL